jgi:D-sedoheptulose 7-phosphate isomerase
VQQENAMPQSAIATAVIDGFRRELDDHLAIAARTRSEAADAFAAMVEVSVAALKHGHKLLFFGNGGSAADAQHLATEFVVRFRNNRPSLPALALTTDCSALTAIGNDFGFDQIFSRQIEGLGTAGDVAIGISTSGNSPNVLLALAAARARGLATIALAGGDGGKMRELADVTVIVPSKVTARIQEMHIFIGHALCDAIERSFGYHP